MCGDNMTCIKQEKKVILFINLWKDKMNVRVTEPESLNMGLLNHEALA